VAEKHYVRPLGLLWGPDAVRGVAEEQAGSLAGGIAAFTHAEMITRANGGVRRRLATYREARSAMPDIVKTIERPRAPFAGLAMDRPVLMGIINVTPDSFSDGGRHDAPGAGIAHGQALVAEGAAILDVGGESTRPGAADVAIEEELARVLPIVRGLSEAGHTVSIDTRKAPVMAEAVAAGAAVINDVSGLGFDPDSLSLAARLGKPVVLMHAQGTPQTMQLDPRYDNVALDIYDYLEARIAACEAAGLPRRLIAADPGIGFGKTSRHNVELMQQLTVFHALGVPLLIGLSRKGFTGALTGETDPRQRVHGSVQGAVQAALAGAQILRVHDVRATRQALAVAFAVADPGLSGL
jgi:dihydropteroate synthase